MTLSMARCIGRSGCEGTPSSRGLCGACYARHRDRGSLGNFPTMRERTYALRVQGVSVVKPQGPALYRQKWRDKQHANRVVLNGFLVHPTASHGRVSTYTMYGCRGPMCRATQRWYRDTGEGSLPQARNVHRTAEECVAFQDLRSDD